MFTWMQTVMQKHYKWLFSILLVIIVVAFVFVIGNQPPTLPEFGDEGQGQPYYGYDLQNPRDERYIQQASGVSARLSPLIRSITGPFGARDDQQFQFFVLGRIALVQQAKSIRFPLPTQPQYAAFVRSLPAFAGEDGTFSRSRHTAVLDSLKEQNISEEFVTQVLIEDWQALRMLEALSGPPLVLPQEAARHARLEETIWSLDIARLNRDTFDPEVTPTGEALREFYQANLENYRTPQAYDLSYVLFPAQRYRDQVDPPGEAALREFFEQDPQRFAPESTAPQTEGEAPPEPEEPAFEAVKPEVRQAWLQRRAVRLAALDAVDLQKTLVVEKIPYGSDAFQEALAEKDIALRDLEPLTAEEAATQDELPPELIQRALQLSGRAYQTDPYTTGQGALIVFLEQRIEPTPRPFEAVRDQVLADYLQQEQQRLYAQRVAELYRNLGEQVEEGTPFDEAARQAGLSVNSFVNFTLQQAPQAIPRELLRSIVRGAREGELVLFSDQGTIAFLRDKQVPQITAEDTNLDQQMQSLAFQYETFGTQALIRELIDAGLGGDPLALN